MDCTSYFNAIDINNIKKIILSSGNLTVLMNDGNLYSSGNNTNGQYGIGSTTRSGTLTLTATNVLDAKGNYNFGLFILKSDNLLYSAGYNNFYQLGTTASNTTVTTFTVATNPQKLITSGNLDSLNTFVNGAYLLYNNVLYVTGTQNNGALGNGINSSTTANSFNSSPTAGYLDYSSIIKSFSVSASYTSPVFITNTAPYVTGYGGYGQLGTGNTATQTHFVTMSTLSQYLSITNNIKYLICTTSLTLAVSSDNKMYGCGGTGSNMLPGYSVVQSSFVPITLPH